MTYQPIWTPIYNSTPPTLSNGQTAPLQIASNGALLVTTAPLPGASVSVTSSAGSSATLTIPGSSMYNSRYIYITGLSISRISASSVTGNAILTITTSNLNDLSFLVGNYIAAGTSIKDVDNIYSVPLRSQNTYGSVSFSLPAAGTGVIWQATVYYYYGT
jgi:hypothetical protein